eukprot:639371-Prorocentrum_minimum.AAC.3
MYCGGVVEGVEGGGHAATCEDVKALVDRLERLEGVHSPPVVHLVVVAREHEHALRPLGHLADGLVQRLHRQVAPHVPEVPEEQHSRIPKNGKPPPGDNHLVNPKTPSSFPPDRYHAYVYDPPCARPSRSGTHRTCSQVDWVECRTVQQPRCEHGAAPPGTHHACVCSCAGPRRRPTCVDTNGDLTGALYVPEVPQLQTTSGLDHPPVRQCSAPHLACWRQAT